MINNKEYLALKHDVLIKLDKYSNDINTNILYMLKQESNNDDILRILLQSFFAEDNDVIRLDYIEKILMQITNADALNNDLFGKHINTRHLFILDVLNELNFISFSINMINEMYNKKDIKSNFEVLKMSEFAAHLSIAKNINDEFEELKFNIYSKLMNQMSENISFASSKRITNLSSFVDTCGIAIMRHKEGGKQIIVEALKAFENYNVINGKQVDSALNEVDSDRIKDEDLMNAINYLYS